MPRANVEMANRTGVTRLRRAMVLAAGVGIPISWLVVSAAAAAMPVSGPDVLPVVDPAGSAAKTVVVSDAAEGWYAPSITGLCSTPLGCPSPLLPSVYPANTLHVGVVLTQETATTYLKPDLSKLPAGAAVVRATMTLPVASGATDGTVDPAAATLIACPAGSAFTDGAADSLETPPKASCAHPAPLQYDAKRNVFTADLTQIVASWATGMPENGIAVVADSSKVSLTDAWHVAFNGRKLAFAPHIETAISYLPAADTQATGGQTPTPTPTPTGTAPAEPQLALPGDGSVTDVQPPAPVLAPTPAPAAATVALSHGFKYPMAFLFPIALLAIGVFLSRLFSSDATPMKRR